MTKQLEQVFTEVYQLPEAEQDALAMLIGNELLWDRAPKNSQSLL